VPQVVGLKVPGVDVARGLTDRFAVFVAGHTLATGYRAGAAGSYSNVACMSPAGAVRWYRLMGTDPAAAAEVEDRMRGFLERQVAPLAADGYSDPALDKALCAVGGWCRTGTRVRWPHRWVPAEAVPALREAALAAVPDLLADPVGAQAREAAEHAARPAEPAAESAAGPEAGRS
jgi:dihydrodipicolinate synthase/N-acetylneuraminate lyase